MKNLLISALLLFSIKVFSQQNSEEPFKDATTITIKTQNSDSLNMKMFSERLLDYDYFIRCSNEPINILETELHSLKTHPDWSHQYLYRIRFKNGDIIIKPFWTGNMSLTLGGVTAERQLYQWEYTISKGFVTKMMFDETMEMIRGYCDCKILFSK